MPVDSTPGACVWCGAPITQRVGEQNLHFAKRVSCNPSCGNKARWERDKTRLAPKECVVCGSSFEHDGEKPYQHVKRETCSPSCKITLANRRRYAKVEPAPKPCVICGTEIRRRDNEMPAGFKLRKTCGDTCHFELISRQKIEHHAEIRSTPYPPHFTEGLKLQVRRRDGFVCQECGCVELLHRAHSIHHIDYDKDNCEMSNLITLCQPCHVRTNWNREYWMARFRA